MEQSKTGDSRPGFRWWLSTQEEHAAIYTRTHSRASTRRRTHSTPHPPSIFHLPSPNRSATAPTKGARGGGALPRPPAPRPPAPQPPARPSRLGRRLGCWQLSAGWLGCRLGRSSAAGSTPQTPPTIIKYGSARHHSNQAAATVLVVGQYLPSSLVVQYPHLPLREGAQTDRFLPPLLGRSTSPSPFASSATSSRATSSTFGLGWWGVWCTARHASAPIAVFRAAGIIASRHIFWRSFAINAFELWSLVRRACFCDLPTLFSSRSIGLWDFRVFILESRTDVASRDSTSTNFVPDYRHHM